MSRDFIIRPVKPMVDAPVLLDIYAPYVETTAVTFEYEVPTIKEFRRRIRETITHFPYLVAEDDSGILGYAYAHPFHPRPAYSWCVEVSVYIAPDQRKRGLGRALYDAITEILCRQGVLLMVVLVASVEGEDPYLGPDSVLFHHKMGFTDVGTMPQCGYKFNRWYDMTYMIKRIGEAKTDIPPVILYPELKEGEECK